MGSSQCLEKGKDPFASDPVLRSFEDVQKRLYINIDGTVPVDSDEEGALSPGFNETGLYGNGLMGTEFDAKGGFQHQRLIPELEYPAANETRYVNQCLIQAPPFP